MLCALLLPERRRISLKNGYNYEDYLFISSRIRAKENFLIGKNDLLAMASLGSTEELYRMLDDKGVVAENDVRNGRDYDKALSKRLSEAFSSVLSDVPEKKLFAVLTYPYDCHNVKTAIKYLHKGVSGSNVMIPLGSVSPEKVEAAVIKGEETEIPRNMSAAIKVASDEFCKTKDPQMIDLIMDYACFEDMAEAVMEYPVPFMRELLALKADTVNIYTAFRMARRYSEKAFAPNEKTFVLGGNLPIEVFSEMFDGSDSDTLIGKLADKLAVTEYAEIADALRKGERDIGKLCEELYISKVRQARQTLAGAEVAAGYLVASEYEVRNLRILIAGKRAGLDARSIIERLRGSYV